MRIISICTLIVIIYSCANKETPNTSFKPGELWLDNKGIHINAHGGGILYHNSKYYWYGEHKISGQAGNKAHVGVHVYSSDDLYNWMDEGIALEVNMTDTSHDIAKGCILERPKVIYNKKTDKFVMWFHLELKGEGYRSARSGVAVADNPAGPFAFLRSFRPNSRHWPVNMNTHQKNIVTKMLQESNDELTKISPASMDSLKIFYRDFEEGQMARDMTLFVDNDNKAYHIYASEENSTLHISQLTDDYTSYSGNYGRFFINRYMEAPAILKTSEGKYYFIGSGCTGWKPNAARSAVADNIMGPWKELGNPCVGKDSSLTFNSQSTFMFPVQGMKDKFIFMADRWTPKNAIDGRYIWLPVKINNDRITLEWKDEWDLN